ncbi:hypothetical protein HDU84_001599 [Entophlyctis sp. JEL0112]|nr:hypothetical protein HDU84_001599 [Entophlyctis sp. JEL0112]
MLNVTTTAIRSGVAAYSSVMDEAPTWYHYAGISFALKSLFIGTSFIFKKKGLMQTASVHGELGHGHLDNPLWWTGMVLMQREVELDGQDWVCIQCVIGSVLIVLHAPESRLFPDFLDTPGRHAVFIFYFIVCTCAIGYLIAPTHSDKNPIVYILIRSLVGSFLMISCQGFGLALVYTFSHWFEDNQFLQWPIYPLMGFIGAAHGGGNASVLRHVYDVHTVHECGAIPRVHGELDDGLVSLVMGFTGNCRRRVVLFEFNERPAGHKVWCERRAVGGVGGAGVRFLGSLESFFSQSVAEADVPADTSADGAGAGGGCAGGAAGKDTHTLRGVAVLRPASLAGPARTAKDTDERTPIMEQPQFSAGKLLCHF